MNTTSPDSAGNYRPHTLDEFPELTPEEMGRRFLKLVDSLKSIDDLTLEHIQEVMRLRLTPTPGAPSAFFNMNLPESGWYYNVVYYDDPRSHRKNVSYNFLNYSHDQMRDQVHVKGFPDMTPVCGLDFNAHVTELKKMGFVEREDLAQYDSPMPPMNADGTMAERQVFRLPGYFFSRGNISVLIRERREALISARRETDPPDDKLNHVCVESISVGGG